MSEMPWVRFYPSDWLGGTRGMSAAETGIYITLVATMYERGEPIPEDHSRLARLCGSPYTRFVAALENLIVEGKIVRSEKGLWNERVQKENSLRSEKRNTAQLAANTRWATKPNKNNDSIDADALPTQCDSNANQKPEARKKEDTVAIATGANAPVDYRDMLWREGSLFISQNTGMTTTAAKSMIGRWLKDTNDDCRLVLTKIKQAEADRVVDPVAWVSAAIRPPPKKLTMATMWIDEGRKQGILDDPTNSKPRRLESGDARGAIEGSYSVGRFAGT